MLAIGRGIPPFIVSHKTRHAADPGGVDLVLLLGPASDALGPLEVAPSWKANTSHLLSGSAA